jgi:hypothetical protein
MSFESLLTRAALEQLFAALLFTATAAVLATGVIAMSLQVL